MKENKYKNSSKNRSYGNGSGNGYRQTNDRYDNRGRDDRNDIPDVEIKAPYNFVPLPDKVVIPEWGPLISQDMPFSDGISGTISLKLTAESPIFVRNGYSREDAEAKNMDYSSFCNMDGKYFLPGTTVKGAIRSILEILSFGKMRLDQTARFAQREWYNTKLYKIKTPEIQRNLRCGWLKFNNDGSCTITDCGIAYRISHPNIERYLSGIAEEGKDSRIFTSKFSDNVNFKLNKRQRIGGQKDTDYDPKSAVYKYKLIEYLCGLKVSRKLSGILNDLMFSIIKDRKVFYDPTAKNIVRGSIVLTGQSSYRGSYYNEKKGKTIYKGKFFEFVFPKQLEGATTYTITRKEFNQYSFIYADSPDWKYLMENKPYGDNGVPVFFRLEEGKLKDWGLAYLYKLPYEKTPYETLGYMDKVVNGMDMAECIFGKVFGSSALKGRVQFSTFMSYNAEPYDKPIELTLGSPKASYYPAYIDQEEVGQDGVLKQDSDGNYPAYRTYNDGKIRGWKRYVRRKEIWGEHVIDNDKSDGRPPKDNKFTPAKMIPLKKTNKEGTNLEFNGKIRFHNLRPIELGALLSAITFHGNQRDCRHLIGQGKPYGYGKVKATVTGFSIKPVGEVPDLKGKDIQDIIKGYMALFEKYMEEEINKNPDTHENGDTEERAHRNWTETATLEELFTLARFDGAPSQCFQYMKMGMGKDKNEFVKVKEDNKYLKRFSKIIIRSYKPLSLQESPTAKPGKNKKY